MRHVGIFDTIIDGEGRRHQTKWRVVSGHGVIEPLMREFRVGEPLPTSDGDYGAISETDGVDMVVEVRGHRIVRVRPPGSPSEPDGAAHDPLRDAIRLLQDLYNNDALFVVLSPQERRAYAERIRAVLDAFGADHDGRAGGDEA